MSETTSLLEFTPVFQCPINCQRQSQTMESAALTAHWKHTNRRCLHFSICNTIRTAPQCLVFLKRHKETCQLLYLGRGRGNRLLFRVSLIIPMKVFVFHLAGLYFFFKFKVEFSQQLMSYSLLYSHSILVPASLIILPLAYTSRR